jgi:RNA polymerase sigma factor (sigma-70 family)
MPRPPWNLFGRLVRRLPAADGDPAADVDLLARFVTDRDPAAFELLVWRHGGLVLGVCRRILRDEHLAEDAFQATFLVLAKKAGSVRGQNVAGWLHKVARRVAVRVAKKRATVAARENTLTQEPAVETAVADHDWAAILDAEVSRLPERFRLPVLLCYLQDYTTDEAARALGIPRGTVLSRLATARQTLAARLTRRGVALPATLVSTSLVSNQLVSATVRSAAAFAVGDAALTSVPTLLATEVIRMSAWKLPAAVAAAMVLTVTVGSGVAWVQGGGGLSNPHPGQAENRPGSPKPAAVKPDGRKAVDPSKSAQDEREQFTRLQIEGLNQYLADRHKDLDRLVMQMTQKYQQRMDIAIEPLPQLEKRYSDLLDTISLLQRDALRDEAALLEKESRLRDLEACRKEGRGVRPEDASIDPSSRDGIRLNAMYRKQADVEMRIRELSLEPGPNEGELKKQTTLLTRLLTDIESLEKQARDKVVDRLKAKVDSEYDVQLRNTQSELNLLKKTMEIRKAREDREQSLLKSMAKTLILVKSLDREYDLLKEKVTKLEWEIHDSQDKRNRYEISKLPGLDRLFETSTDQVFRELSNLRREVADLKKK